MLSLLTREKLLKPRRGRRGGYYLAREPPKSITAWDVLEAIESDYLYHDRLRWDLGLMIEDGQS